MINGFYGENGGGAFHGGFRGDEIGSFHGGFRGDVFGGAFCSGRDN
jgi:hypothetical protein